MVAPRIIVGASATIAASHGRCLTVNAVAMTATSRNTNRPRTFKSKNPTTGSKPKMSDTGVANNDATHMNTPVSTGYSNGCPPGGVCT